MTDFYKQPGFWLYLAVWLPYTLLVIIYGLGSPWYASPIGRAFWLSKLALSLLLTFVLTIWIFGQYPGLSEVRSALMVVLALGAWYQLAVVIRIQRAKRRDRDVNPPRSTDS